MEYQQGSSDMDWASSDIITIIFYLLPGFIAAWVFYGFTGFEPPDMMSRVIQAMILTMIIRVLAAGMRELSYFLAEYVLLGTWTEDVELAWSIALAFAVGVIYAVSANNDLPHRWLRHVNGTQWVGKLSLTVNTADPSEWYGAFSTNNRWVTLHLDGERRILGWPREWPNTPQAGHFVIEHARWIDDEGKQTLLRSVQAIMIPVTSVQIVEFMLNPDEELQPAEAHELSPSLED